MKVVLGLTGGSGTGKSVAARYFHEFGAEIIDADRIARQIMEPGSPALSEVSREFPGVLLSDGSLNRKKLGSLVFKDEASLKKLNAITHQYIIDEIKTRLICSQSNFIVIDAPLLLECNLDQLCTASLCILADFPLRISRIMARDGLTKEQAENRINSQNDDNFYKSRCRYAVYNNGDIKALTASLDSILKELLV